MDLTKLSTSAEREIPQFAVKTKAFALPITLEDAKDWLKRTGTASEDTLITSIIKEAAAHVENIIGRSLMERVCQYYVPEPEEFIYLPFTASEIVSVKDSEGNPVAHSVRGLSNKYIVLNDSNTANRITVEYKSGTPDPENLESGILAALKKLIVEVYENRGDSAAIDMNGTSESTKISVSKLLYPYRRNILL